MNMFNHVGDLSKSILSVGVVDKATTKDFTSTYISKSHFLELQAFCFYDTIHIVGIAISLPWYRSVT